MEVKPAITRTPHGYRLNNLEAVGLPPRTSQALLLTANDYTTVLAAHIMQCSDKNVSQLLDRLRDKAGANTRTGLIASSFQRGWLRITALAVAVFLGIGGDSALSTLLNLPADDVTQTTARGRRTRTQRRKGEPYWDDETQQLKTA